MGLFLLGSGYERCCSRILEGVFGSGEGVVIIDVSVVPRLVSMTSPRVAKLWINSHRRYYPSRIRRRRLADDDVNDNETQIKRDSVGGARGSRQSAYTVTLCTRYIYIYICIY